MKKHFKIVYLPYNSSKIREFNFSLIKLFLLLISTIFIFILITIYGVNFLTNGMYDFKIKKLQKDKTILNNQLLYMQNIVENIKNEVKTLVKKDDEMRIMADLPKYDEDVRDVGVGGSVTNKYSLSSFYSEEEELSYTLLENLNKFERQIDLENESYQEILEKIKLNMEMVTYWPSIRPVEGGKISEKYGPRRHPINGKLETHRAIDISVPLGTPVMAAADGIVEYSGKNSSYGNYIRINHQSEKFGYKTAYGHLNRIFVRTGQKVKRGDIIGEVGRTGSATAPHLHYEVIKYDKQIDPIETYYDPEIIK